MGKFLIYCSYQSVSVSLRVGENFVLVSNSLDPDEMPNNWASHLDNGTSVLIGRLRVNQFSFLAPKEISFVMF